MRKSAPRVSSSLVIVLAAGLALPSCAKDPASGDVPYGGSIGMGPDWNSDVTAVELTVDFTRKGRSISPRIYGFNAAKDASSAGFGALRQGGNRYTAYNWENNASNAGNDFMFQNDAFLVTGSPTADVPGDAVRPMLEEARRLGASAVVTVPIVDHVAADELGGGNVNKSGPDYLTTRFRQNRPTKGAAFSLAPDLSDGLVYQDEFASWVKSGFSDVDVMFSLDNEPDLWSATHAEVHPAPVTYAELVQRNTDFATALKAVWPEAPILGFVSYGWNGYLTLQNAPDAAGKGDFVSYYLAQMKTAGEAAGVRLVDYLDLHWYPEAVGKDALGKMVRITDNDVSPGVVTARVQAPRSFWEPGYRETSWVSGSLSGGIALIPRMQQKVDAQYPGTQLAFSEWNFGAGDHISGGVAVADTLGVFGREGVGAANYWPTGGTSFVTAAIRAYRNYDGAGAHFGDTSVSAETSSMFSSSVYAAVDSGCEPTCPPGGAVIVAINKRSSPTRATLKIAGDSTSTAGLWVLEGTRAEVTKAPPLTATAPGTFVFDMPALSVNVVVPGAGAPP